MFGHSFFGKSFFGPSYFGPGVSAGVVNGSATLTNGFTLTVSGHAIGISSGRYRVPPRRLTPVYNRRRLSTRQPVKVFGRSVLVGVLGLVVRSVGVISHGAAKLGNELRVTVSSASYVIAHGAGVLKFGIEGKVRAGVVVLSQTVLETKIRLIGSGTVVANGASELKYRVLLRAKGVEDTENEDLSLLFDDIAEFLNEDALMGVK